MTLQKKQPDIYEINQSLAEVATHKTTTTVITSSAGSMALVMRRGRVRWNWSCAVDEFDGIGHVPWTSSMELVMCRGRVRWNWSPGDLHLHWHIRYWK
jgi:hypothetical protein